MCWLHQPSYAAVRDRLIEQLRASAHQVSSRSPIVFLCGGSESPRRQSLAAYLRRNTNALVFYAEDIWGAIRDDAKADALKMEGRLAELADIVIVIVESPGTLAELGAFSLHSGLLRKLLPIVDSRYETDESFINTGPIQSVKQGSAFRPAIYTKFTGSFLLCAAEVEQRLKIVPNLNCKLVPAYGGFSSKQFLLFVVRLVALLFPVTEQHLDFYVSSLFASSQPMRTREVLSLAISLRLLRRLSSASMEPFYVPVEYSQPLSTDGFNHSVARARIFGVLQRLPQALTIIEQMEDERCVAS